MNLRLRFMLRFMNLSLRFTFRILKAHESKAKIHESKAKIHESKSCFLNLSLDDHFLISLIFSLRFMNLSLRFMIFLLDS